MLKIKNLKASINGTKIIKGINLQVNAGEIHAIMGPNGSGKSTLSSVLSGHPDYQVDAGTITFDRQDLLNLSPEDRARNGLFMAFQYPVEIPGVSIGSLLKAALNEKRKSRGEEPIEAIKAVQMIREKAQLVDMGADFLSRGVNEGFSGGEKKRNEILQMAVLQPKLAILDETDSGLDVDALKMVGQAINKLRTKENAFIIITHYPRILEYLKPDKVHVMYNGRIIKSGGKDLAKKIEQKGYDWLKKSTK